jgi:endoglucanase
MMRDQLPTSRQIMIKKTFSWASRALLGVTLTASSASAQTHIRHNAAGYSPGREIRLVVMSAEDLAGEPWSLAREGQLLEVGRFRTVDAGRGPHTPFAYNYGVRLPAGLAGPGIYEFTAGKTSVPLRVAERPYEALLHAPLVHLRRMRSGPEVVPPRKPSHPGDAAAPVWIPRGDPAEGAWQVDPAGRKVDVEGGWYDAGDQLKFTLNIAYTSYHLLLAYDLSPALFEGQRGPSGLPEVLEEARHGLEWLMKVHPSAELFVVQVGDERDHNQPARLPENDALDGRRPALSALSRVHLASASAALAMGAHVWKLRGDGREAARYLAMAERLFARLERPDTILTAFERGKVNDFYRDDSSEDQTALAATRLYRLTHNPHYREVAENAAPGPASGPSWSQWHWSANLAMVQVFDDRAAAKRLLEETAGAVRHARKEGQPWGLPAGYVWASLHRWIEAGVAARLCAVVVEPCRDRDRLFEDMLDYTFGRNNWGVSFLFTEELPNTVRNIYSPAYRLLDLFPTGALSEGPGNRDGHERLSRYFQIAADDPFHRFNTEAGVFFDNATDFMCQEATIVGQADILLLLTLAALYD